MSTGYRKHGHVAEWLLGRAMRPRWLYQSARNGRGRRDISRW
jgi:hypothetical protein